MKINDFRVDLTDILAKKEVLVSIRVFVLADTSGRSSPQELLSCIIKKTCFSDQVSKQD